MSKAILMSKQPQIVANVLNENSKLLVCKKFPKDYKGWVYIYCTKGKLDNVISLARLFPNSTLNEILGKVVARFWCNYVNKCRVKHRNWEGKLIEEYIEYVVDFSKLEVFDKPRELSEFVRACPTEKCCKCKYAKFMCGQVACDKPRLTKASKNYCYIEVEE